MHVAQYFVVFHDSEWRIRYKGTYYGPYDRQKTAISQAIDMALIVGQSGGKAEVLVENEKGEARLEWPLSHDQAAAGSARLTPPPTAVREPAPKPAAPAAPVPQHQPQAIWPPVVAVPDAAPAATPVIAAPVVDDDGHDDEPAPPRESSIEELAAIMAAALDGTEAGAPAAERLPLLPGDDKGPGTIGGNRAAK